MPRHVLADERAARLDLEPLGARFVERAAHELRGDAAALQVRRRLGVEERHHAAVEAVVGDGGAGLGVELEAGEGGVVADRHDGHVGGDAGKLNRAMPPP